MTKSALKLLTRRQGEGWGAESVVLLMIGFHERKNRQSHMTGRRVVGSPSRGEIEGGRGKGVDIKEG